MRDLPRNADGSAILVEARNDENQIISQIHVALLKAHNRLVGEGLGVVDAQRGHGGATRRVLNEFVPHVTSPTVTGLLGTWHPQRHAALARARRASPAQRPAGGAAADARQPAP